MQEGRCRRGTYNIDVLENCVCILDRTLSLPFTTSQIDRLRSVGGVDFH